MIVDDDVLGRLYISKTLLRHYPESVVLQCRDLNTALEFVHALPVKEHGTIVIAHRTAQLDGHELITALRSVHPSVPIIWLGAPEQSELTQTSGANRFLDKNAWLMIGETVADLI